MIFTVVNIHLWWYLFQKLRLIKMLKPTVKKYLKNLSYEVLWISQLNFIAVSSIMFLQEKQLKISSRLQFSSVQIIYVKCEEKCFFTEL